MTDQRPDPNMSTNGHQDALSFANQKHISPAIGEFAVQEMDRLRAVNAELREMLSEVVSGVHWRFTKEDNKLRERALTLLSNQARAAIAKARGQK